MSNRSNILKLMITIICILLPTKY